MEMKWYVLQAYAGTENKAADLLRTRFASLGLSEYVEDVVVPSEDVIEIKDGKRKKVQQRFLPGYVLARMAINDDVLNAIKDVRLVFGFIGGTPNNPKSISEAEVSAILSKVQASSDSPKPRVMYEVGSAVRITDGPFADFDATVEQVNYEKNTMRVTVAVFGRPTPVELSFDSVVRI